MDSTQAQAQAQYQTAYLEAIRRRQQAFRHMINFITLVVRMIIITALGVVQSRYLKQPWHTSILTGHMWVLELLGGHPECIRTALGCNHHTFYMLIAELCALGHTNSKYVTLEEQLAIFLYCCVMGLTIRHVGERFQRSNDTVSR